MVTSFIFRKSNKTELNDPKIGTGHAPLHSAPSTYTSGSPSMVPMIEPGSVKSSRSSSRSGSDIDGGSTDAVFKLSPALTTVSGGRVSPRYISPPHLGPSSLIYTDRAQSLPSDGMVFGSPTIALQLDAGPKPIFFARSSVSSLKKLSNSPPLLPRDTENDHSADKLTYSQRLLPSQNSLENAALMSIDQKQDTATQHSGGSNLYRHSESQDHRVDTNSVASTAVPIAIHNTSSFNRNNNGKTGATSNPWIWWPWGSAPVEQEQKIATSEENEQTIDTSLAEEQEVPSNSWSSYFWTNGNDTAVNNTSQNSNSDTEQTGAPKRTNGELSGIKSPPSSPLLSAQPEDPDIKVDNSNGTRSWAFWSRSSDKESEFAVSGTSTEDHPYKAQQLQAAEQEENIIGDEAAKDMRDMIVKPTKEENKIVKKIKKPNIVTPDSDMCYSLYSSVYQFRSSLSRLTSYVLPKHEQSPMTKLCEPLFRTTPAKVHKVVVIGVHGFFPAKVVRAIIGEPTGTSIKFANEAAKSVERWANEKGYEVEIEKIALEGEGKVLKRVNTLYKLLCNWLNLIYEADFIYFAAHSQGTPVAVHLLARLVEEGHVEGKRIALLGMAGISLGPIYGLDQKILMRAISQIESASLKELFEFQNLESHQSRKYIESLRTIIGHNAKIVFVGSMNDQLVPLYSSICTHVTHPNIFRAVFVDSQNVAPEFISTLVSVALQLRNIGSSDHGLIREVSGAFPGTLTSGGHSRIYDEGRVYDLLMRHALETTDAPKSIPLKVNMDFEIPRNNHNPYLLPWTMRGMVNEAAVRPRFNQQLELLNEEFNQWKPEAKPMKDLKYRLSAIQSRL